MCPGNKRQKTIFEEKNLRILYYEDKADYQAEITLQKDSYYGAQGGQRSASLGKALTKLYIKNELLEHLYIRADRELEVNKQKVARFGNESEVTLRDIIKGPSGLVPDFELPPPMKTNVKVNYGVHKYVEDYQIVEMVKRKATPKELEKQPWLHYRQSAKISYVEDYDDWASKGRSIFTPDFKPDLI